MDNIHNFYAEIQALERRELISLYWLKRWMASVIIVFMLFNYIWNSIFSNLHDSHIPFALLSQKQQLEEMRMHFRSDAEIRISQINKINFVIFACNPKSQNSNGNETDVSVAIEAIRTMKSVTLFTKKIIHFHIFTEDTLYPSFILEIDKWPNFILHRVTFEFHAANYPEAVLDSDFKKDKATQKACDLSFLFISSIVKNLDFAIYARSGVIFLSSIDDLWMNFRDYSKHNALALPFKFYNGECRIADRFYSNQIYHVYDTSLIEYDILRLQTSVFNIPVLRKSEFKDNKLFPLNTKEFETVSMTWNPTMLLTVYNLFKPYITEPGIDLLNIIALFNPEKIYSLPYEWNVDVTACNDVELQCPNAKLIIHNEKSRCCFSGANFQMISELFDRLDLKEQSLVNITKILQRILNWPNYNLYSLNNFL